MNKKLIGILAGMGPRSTAPFVDLIIDECQSQYGARYDEEFPEIMIYSLPTPFYIDRAINHELMKKTIIKGLKKLESIGTNFIAMPCNSAHIYFEELKESIGIPLLNIVEETIKYLPAMPQKVTLLSTSSTFESTIYQKGITKAGHEFIFKEEWQKKINALIQNIKTDKNNPQNINIWNELLESIKFESIENIVIACTDLNVVLEKIQPSINIIDSSKCLAESVIKKYLELEK
ncbi:MULTISPECIES: amino acid racemase [unclassified Clostridioides]|uniref:aspartate/glutamate racemase family protein n=1 Tax=unclassified Clostridioides TaxID=2635829 RepID=UPI001D0C214D|nr:amino acid racemase [Clostridioides sp. ES-S-0001-02]MCC0763978.1 amino acid racemase [Clostridioides sp. ES-S-0006-03]